MILSSSPSLAGWLSPYERSHSWPLHGATSLSRLALDGRLQPNYRRTKTESKFRVASLFVPLDEKLNGSDVGAPAEKNGDDTAVWWPHLAAGGRVGEGTGVGEEGEAADG